MYMVVIVWFVVYFWSEIFILNNLILSVIKDYKWFSDINWYINLI